MRCNCPYVICRFHGDCAACIEHNRLTGDLAHCMEERAMDLGARLPLRLPKTLVEEDYRAMSLACARRIRDVVREKPDALLTLAAGSTAIGTFEALREMQAAGEIDLGRARFAALDEWLDLEDESENCDGFMRRHFYGPLGIGDERVIRFDIHAEDPEQACQAMDAAVAAAGGVDFLLLGMGMNGHLGLNEPGTDFSRRCHVAELDDVTRQVGQKYFSQGMRLSRGITMGVRNFFDARQVVLQVSGSHKAAIVERMYRTAPTEQLPATVLKLLPQGTVVLDREAAAGVWELL